MIRAEAIRDHINQITKDLGRVRQAMIGLAEQEKLLLERLESAEKALKAIQEIDEKKHIGLYLMRPIDTVKGRCYVAREYVKISRAQWTRWEKDKLNRFEEIPVLMQYRADGNTWLRVTLPALKRETLGKKKVINNQGIQIFPGSTERLILATLYDRARMLARRTWFDAHKDNVEMKMQERAIALQNYLNGDFPPPKLKAHVVKRPPAFKSKMMAREYKAAPTYDEA